METKEVQTMLKETKDVGVETNRTPMGAVIIQKEKEKKKKSKMQKKQIKSIPNATPSQEQQFRIFQNIDYPYLMRNVEIQEEDKMVKALKEVFGIKEKTPEMVADEAIEKSYGKSRSFPLYTDAELTQQELRARAINRDTTGTLRAYAGFAGLFDDDDDSRYYSSYPPVPRSLEEMVKDYSDYLKQYERERERQKELARLGEERSLAFGSRKPLEVKEYSGRGRPGELTKKFKESEAGRAKERATLSLSLEGAKTSAPIFSGEEIEALYEVSEKKTIEKAKARINALARLPFAREEVKRRVRQKDFDDNLAKIKKERERMDKEIEKSFNLYEASRKAKEGGEMASLLFD
jgi:hypothetical protein